MRDTEKQAGTWYRSCGCGGQGIVAEETSGRTVAVAYDEKDADLLAAAPDLLEVCEDLLDSFSEIPWELSSKIWAAVRKARGE